MERGNPCFSMFLSKQQRLYNSSDFIGLGVVESEVFVDSVIILIA